MSDPRKNDPLAKEYFEDHEARVRVAHLADGGQMTCILWRKPGTGINLVRYVIDGHVLYVSGDLGEAVYVWSEKVDLGFLAGLDLGYFASKCQASEYGRGYRSWSPEKARRFLENDVQSWYDDPADPELARAREVLAHAAHFAGDWASALASLQDEGLSRFQDAMYECAAIGYEPDIRCQLHLLGLRMIAELVEKEGTT